MASGHVLAWNRGCQCVVQGEIVLVRQRKMYSCLRSELSLLLLLLLLLLLVLVVVVLLLLRCCCCHRRFFRVPTRALCACRIYSTRR